MERLCRRTALTAVFRQRPSTRKFAGRIPSFNSGTPGEVGGVQLLSEDIIVAQAAGGGGYGDPLDRPPPAVWRDVEEGYISSAAAQAVYGVVLSADGAVAQGETELLRSKLRERRIRLTIQQSDVDDFEVTANGRRRIIRLNSFDLGSVEGSSWSLLEIVPSSGAPLRGWCLPSETIVRGTLPLNEETIKALTCERGTTIGVRRI